MRAAINFDAITNRIIIRSPTYDYIGRRRRWHAQDLNEGYRGNRIMFALETENGPGFDLVSLSSGALRIGINQWPDGGIVEFTGELTIGNFGVVVGARDDLGPNGPSRVFRGLIDEVKVFDRATRLATSMTGSAVPRQVRGTDVPPFSTVRSSRANRGTGS